MFTAEQSGLGLHPEGQDPIPASGMRDHIFGSDSRRRRPDGLAPGSQRRQSSPVHAGSPGHPIRGSEDVSCATSRRPLHQVSKCVAACREALLRVRIPHCRADCQPRQGAIRQAGLCLTLAG
jgi:hypothetical protein